MKHASGLNRLVGAALIALSLAACSTGSAPDSDAPTPAAVTPPAGEETLAAPAPGTEGLAGRLIFTEGLQGISVYDLASGVQTSLFQPPQLAFVQSASVSPDGSTILMAYAPPPPGNDPTNYGYSDLYVMPADGSAPPALFMEAPPGELYTHPAWSPDGSQIYFGHTTPAGDAYGGTVGLSVEAMDYPDGAPETIIQNAFGPRVSPDGARLAYVSAAGTVDELAVAGIDGSDPQVIVPADQFAAIDAVTWSPDGEWIYFSAIPYGMESRRPDWLYALLGVGIARAHEAPSDLFRVPASGGEPERLTSIADFGLYPAFSPDGTQIALLRASGIYLMAADGGDMRRLLGQGAIGTLDWVP